MKIIRFRGDTYPESFVLRVDGTPIDLGSVRTAQLAVLKPAGLIVVDGVKDSDPLTGRLTFTFSGELVEDVGNFSYDLQVLGTDDIITTYVKDIISFQADINQT